MEEERAAPDPDDDLLATLDRGDDRGALAMLMTLHGSAVYTRCLRIAGDPSTAQDVLQQTFLEAFRDLRKFERRSTLRTWVIGIATHRALDAVRKRRRLALRLVKTIDEAEDVVSELASPTTEVERRQRTRALEDCLRAASPEARAAVLMRFQDELSFDEMARRLGEKPGTLQARVMRALPALRRCLEDKGMAP